MDVPNREPFLREDGRHRLIDADLLPVCRSLEPFLLDVLKQQLDDLQGRGGRGRKGRVGARPCGAPVAAQLADQLLCLFWAPISGRDSCPPSPQNVPRFWGIALGPGGLAAALTVCTPCESRPCTTAGRGLLLAERSPTSRRAHPRPIPITMIHHPVFARLFLEKFGSALILLFFDQKRVQLCVCVCVCVLGGRGGGKGP